MCHILIILLLKKMGSDDSLKVVDSKASAVTLQEAATLVEGRRLPVAVRSLLPC